VLSHAYVGINDFDWVFAFYAPVLDVLGRKLRFSDVENGWAEWHAVESVRSLFSRPVDRQPACCGNEQIVAFLAPSRAAVNRAYA
jgi:hypothetical protein